MKTITINNVIGFDVFAKDVRKELKNTKDVKIEINSPGGFVSEGIEIYNILKNHAQNNIVHTHIVGMAGSMASVIFLAGNKRTAEKSAMFFIHNAQGVASGDYNKMNKVSQHLQKVSNMMASIYAEKTGLNIFDIKKMMNEETFFYGNEILDNNFAQEIIGTEEVENKEVALLKNKMIIENLQKDLKELDEQQEDLKKACALLENNETMKIEINKNDPQIFLNKKPEGKKMNLSEIQAQYPDLYNQILNLGIEQERDRVKAHLTMGKATGALEFAYKSIEDGESINKQTVIATYQSEGLKTNLKNKRIEDNPESMQIKTENFDNQADLVRAELQKLGALEEING